MPRLFALFLIAAGAIVPLVLWLIGMNLFPGTAALGLGLVFLASVACFLWAARILCRTKPIDDPESTAYGGIVAGLKSGQPVVKDFDGVSCTVLYDSGSKDDPPRLSVSTATAATAGAEFRISPETWFDRLGKRLRLALEVHTGDQAFDDACYVRSDSVRFVDDSFSVAANRNAVMDLKRLGFQKVALEKGVVTAASTWFDTQDRDIGRVVDEAARAITFLANHLPAFDSGRHHRMGRWQQAWVIVLWASLAAYGSVLFLGAPFPPCEISHAVAPTATVVAIIFPAFVVASMAALRGTSTSHDAWKWLMLGALILVPLGSAGLLMRLNGALDESPEATHVARIIDKGFTSTKGPKSYWVTCEPWGDQTGTKKYTVSARQWEKAVGTESKLVIVTRAGWLGIEWKVASWVESR